MRKNRAVTPMNDLTLHEELTHLRRWKAEASEVMIGLQDLGRALDIPPGTRITGELAAEKARKLTAEVERLTAQVSALVDDRESHRRRADKAEAELHTLQDASPYIACGCGRKIYITPNGDVLSALAELADDIEGRVDWSDGRNNYGDNEAYTVCARDIRTFIQEHQ